MRSEKVLPIRPRMDEGSHAIELPHPIPSRILSGDAGLSRLDGHIVPGFRIKLLVHGLYAVDYLVRLIIWDP